MLSLEAQEENLRELLASTSSASVSDGQQELLEIPVF